MPIIGVEVDEETDGKRGENICCLTCYYLLLLLLVTPTV